MPNKKEPPFDSSPRRRGALFLTVLPFYRQACIDQLYLLDTQTVVIAGQSQIDRTVVSGVRKTDYLESRNIFLFEKLIIQTKHWRKALSATDLIVDLNPRCLSAWTLLLLRRLLRRRTLVWGHLFPRAGQDSWTSRIRRFMRTLACGTVLYGYDGVLYARSEVPGQPVWVAPNALYSREVIQADSTQATRDAILYVGRLERPKKVDLLIRGFAAAKVSDHRTRLIVVGSGKELTNLQRLAIDLGVSDRVDFLGHVSDVSKLKDLYARAVCSVSPGYAGLSLTQSLGFGVPMVVSRDEHHAPEIELVKLGGVTFFETDNALSLGRELSEASSSWSESDSVELSRMVRETYSAETMASGIHHALLGIEQELGDDGWPIR